MLNKRVFVDDASVAVKRFILFFQLVRKSLFGSSRERLFNARFQIFVHLLCFDALSRCKHGIHLLPNALFGKKEFTLDLRLLSGEGSCVRSFSVTPSSWCCSQLHSGLTQLMHKRLDVCAFSFDDGLDFSSLHVREFKPLCDTAHNAPEAALPFHSATT